jgi:hypothetical protein
MTMSASEVVGSHPEGSMLTVWVVPGARSTEVVGFYGGALRVRVAAPPERGRANKALIAHISEQLGVRVRLMSGAGSRRKRLVVAGLSAEILATRIDGIVN